jgi:hypothetical protein
MYNLTMMVSDLTKLEQYLSKYYHNVNGSEFTTLTDIIYMAAVRNNISIPVLIEDLYNGILDIYLFNVSNSGSIYNFINKKYRLFAERIKDIKVGSNGGMANVGKGEWLLSICSGINPKTDKPHVNIIKNGRGDIQYLGKNEELKWNGGKVCVEKAGNQVNKNFNKLIEISDKEWVPFRLKDKTKYSSEEIKLYNSIFWKAISDEDNPGYSPEGGGTLSLLSDNELKQKIINTSFIKVFEKSNSFIMFNDNGKFQRFSNIEDADTYYKDKLHLLKGKKGFECRANQNNPIALYCHSF